MKICTITCHDVYNHGASLQAYGLMKYLKNKGHDVEIINYKPDYLSNHYNLLSIDNPVWEKNNITKLIYLTLKLPNRIISLKRKREFDNFTFKQLKLTRLKYSSNEDIKKAPPLADIYICGSDQIWNSLHLNGRDPAFYLDFAPDNKIKASYAASFATETISDNLESITKKRIERLDFISVREKSGLNILDKLNVKKAITVVDPVFLLDINEWNQLAKTEFNEDFILIYDFDNSELIKKIAKEFSEKYNLKIYSIGATKLNYADENFHLHGPDTYISLIKQSKYIISNSFHAAVFSIIYKKDFIIVNRTEAINTRMRDLLDDLNLNDRLIEEGESLDKILINIDYQKVNVILDNKISQSKQFLNTVLSNKGSMEKII
ncbi:polysaccharide pyruvyl transferase family protein [Halalkalibacter akibai]|uniref:Polysaccharide pyruvyl transferase domain-containing protein n=1 Tax=Halalkalibacter akibai (strain ATCC 43226 / DSM 21942 / CIP 109018 / JCM 9157 / 1139) TaxID=1236973 RepID=W4QWB7_HALA3|nr:polysaccharide pyruvyl transferase family protein [Halalkalibacter akibai]GAE35928.1 hypothetical protein JCM9157_3069 [Halalkalibacter akibai JCM 9157]